MKRLAPESSAQLRATGPLAQGPPINFWDKSNAALRGEAALHAGTAWSIAFTSYDTGPEWGAEENAF